MKRTKSSLVLVLAIAILFSTSACTNKTPKSSGNRTTPVHEEVRTDSGAESMEELIEILSESYMFTDQQANTMSNSMLVWCAQELSEEEILQQDASKTSTILNNDLYSFTESFDEKDEANLDMPKIKIFITETEDITNEIVPYDDIIKEYKLSFSDDGYKTASELLMEEKDKINAMWSTSGYIITDDGSTFEFDVSDEFSPYIIEMSGKYFWLFIEMF